MIAKTFGALSPAQQRIIRRMHEMGFGKIRNLPVIHGEPNLAEATFTTRRKLTSPNVACKMEDDIELKSPHFEFFRTCEVIQNGIIACLEIQHGVPCHLEIDNQIL